VAAFLVTCMYNVTASSPHSLQLQCGGRKLFRIVGTNPQHYAAP
jgi:hypothetical protein